MKRFLFTAVCVLSMATAGAQKKPATKRKPPTQTDMQRMMKEAQQMMDQATEGLSPEEKKMMADAMKQAKQLAAQGRVPGQNTDVKIPEKQTAILAKIPKIANQAQYTAYLQSLRDKASKKINASLIAQVEADLQKAKGQSVVLNNLAPTYFLQKSPRAAIYAAIRAAQLQNQPLTQSNLAVILHLTGYPQYALPILEQLNTKTKSANLLNNTGQSYLSLGDKQKALQFFAAALQTNPAHAEANCGTALIKIDEGKTEEAKPYLQQALKHGYSETLAQMTEQKKILLDYNALRCEVPEYFNPNKYKPVPAATNMDEVKKILTQREEMNELYVAWDTKKMENDDQDAVKTENITLMQAGARIPGFFPTAPFGKKALFMVLQVGKEIAAKAYSDALQNNRDADAANALHDALEKSIASRVADPKIQQSANHAYEVCQIQAEEVNKYLQKSAELYEGKVRKTLHQYYDFANQQLYWYRFLLNEEQYRMIFYHTATQLMDNLRSYHKYQRLGQPDYVVTHCTQILQNPSRPQSVTDLPDGSCPVKLKIPFVVGSLKADCKGWEIEGGEGAVLGIQKDYKTGEFTVAFGVGGNLEVPEIGMGAKGQAFFKFDKDFSPIDIGMVMEVGGDAAAGPIMIAEEKLTATMGMTSGIRVGGVHAGKELNIFEYDPAK